MSTRLVLAALCALTLTTAAAADTLVVPTDHQTIGAAVAAANDNDTILVKKGRYAESVFVQGLNGLTIRAKGKVVIAPPEGPGIEVSGCNDIEIRGFTVENAADGFVFDDCDGVDLNRFVVRNADRHGVFAFGSSDVDVSSGKVFGAGRDGISFADEVPESPVVGGSIVSVRVVDCDEDGIDVLGSNIEVIRSRATNCGDDCFESDDLGAGPVRFEKCVAKNCDDEGFELGARETDCIRCKASNTEDDGYDIEADDCFLDRCSAKACDEAGFSIDSHDNIELSGCKAIKCGEQGFDFYEATNANLSKCKAVKTRGDGFHLDNDTTGCVLTKCKGAKSGDFDLNDESDGSNTFPDSKFKKIAD